MTITTPDPTTTDDLTLTVPDDVPVVVITRTFAVPPAAVFRAHTDPDLLVRWLGPADLVMEVDVWDCRPGGEYRYVHSRGKEAHGFRGCFHDVVPDERIVQTFSYEPFPEAVALETLVLRDLGDGRTGLTVTAVAGSFEARDAQLASGMESGIRDGYRQLDDVLAGGPGRGGAA